MKFIWNDIKWLCIYTYLYIYDGRSTKGKTTTMSTFIDFPRFFRQSPMGRSFGFPKLEFHRPGPSNEPSEHQPRHPKLRPGDGFVSASNQLIFLGGECFFRGELWLRLGFFRTFRLPLIHLQKWKVGKYEDDTSEAKTCLLSRVEHSKCKLLSP